MDRVQRFLGHRVRKTKVAFKKVKNERFFLSSWSCHSSFDSLDVLASCCLENVEFTQKALCPSAFA